MWRRVSCEQPLNTSQSILRLRGNLNQMFGCFRIYLEEPILQPKGNLVLIPEPGGGNDSGLRPDVATLDDQETPTGALGRVFFSA